jgi:hypothetical protein
MSNAKTLFLLLSCLVFLSACCNPACCNPACCNPACCFKAPPLFKASKGMAQYEGETYCWINTVDGPIDLTNVTVTHGAMTDQSLAAECSDIASVCIGRKAWISNCIIRGRSSVADRVRIYDSEVKGPLEVGKNLIAYGTTFHCDVTVNGDVSADYCCFSECLTATAEIITLKGTSIQSIYICPCGPYYDKQVLCLKDGTVVYGDIYFPSCRGRVVIDECSRVYGEIHGARVMKAPRP